MSRTGSVGFTIFGKPTTAMILCVLLASIATSSLAHASPSAEDEDRHEPAVSADTVRPGHGSLECGSPRTAAVAEGKPDVSLRTFEIAQASHLCCKNKVLYRRTSTGGSNGIMKLGGPCPAGTPRC